MIKKIMLGSFILLLSFNFVGCASSNTAIDKNMYSATVEANTFNIMAETTGKITDLSIGQGDSINQDQSIAKLDSSTYDIQKRQAQGALDSAKASLASLPDNAKDSQKQQMQGNIDQAQAGVDLAQLQIEKCTIKAQASGMIEDIYINKGEVVSAGTNIAKVIDGNSKYIRIYVEESKRNDIKQNGKVPIYEDNKKICDGVITFIASQSEFTPKNVETKNTKDKTVFEVKIKLDSNSGVSPGAMVYAEIK
ncbi:MAG: HlyD family efflux transporter periplasmic adaptor subunit [Bacillota bacterium]|nr:HlyD family efflux transporter periplasmic adaptor subunit [Bacillota bacterium]